MATHPFIFLLLLSIAFAVERDIKLYWNRLKNPQKVYQLYRSLGFSTIWVLEESKNIRVYHRLLEKLRIHGLKEEDYLPKEGLPLELAYTDSLIRLAYDLYYGRVEPKRLFGGWTIPRKPDIVISLLSELIKEDRLEELIDRLSPPHRDYKRLIEEAEYLEEISSIEWKPIRLNRELGLGDKSPCLDEIRFRLFLLGDLEDYTPSYVFDKELERAVKRFQERHGINPTGKIGQATIKWLNLSPAERLKIIHLNLEKYRWLPEIAQGIIVNIPSFEMHVIKDGAVVLHSKVIVGRSYKEDFRPTPMLYSRVESIIINPKWYVPVSISAKDIVPKVKKDPQFLSKKGFKVYMNGQEIDPSSINWEGLSEENFPYRLVQKAGPKNALGRIKFNLPNPFDVYLHDTPDKHLFKRHRRDFSSGCIRIEKAKELALLLLDGDWSRERLERLINAGETASLKPKNRMPVFILYFTAFEKDGLINYREDIYEYDRILSKALSGGPR